MSTKITLLFFFITTVCFAQTFNRSFVTTGNERNCAVAIDGSKTIEVYSGTDGFLTRPSVKLMDSTGAVLNSDVLSLTTKAGGIEYLSPSGVEVLSNGDYLVYGTYNEVCDVVGESGLFMAEYDSQLQRLKTKVIEDSASLTTYSFVPIDSSHFAMAGGVSITGFDLNLNQTFNYQDTGSASITYAVYKGNSNFLIEKTAYPNLQSFYELNSITLALSPVTALAGAIYDFMDSSYVSFDNLTYTLTVFSKATGLPLDTVYIANIVNFGITAIDVNSDAIVVSDVNGNFAVIDKSDFTPLTSGTLWSENTAGYKQDFFYSNSSIAATTAMPTGQVHLERFKINQPEADIVDSVGVKVIKAGMNINIQDTLGNGDYVISSSTDWKVIVTNKSPEVIHNMNIVYTNVLVSYCGDVNDNIPEYGINLQPGDSIAIYIGAVGDYHPSYNGDYTVWLNVNVAAANENIVTSGGWHSGSYTVHNVGLEESPDLSSVKVYPNPASTYLNIDGLNVSQGSLQIFDITGKVMMKMNVSAKDHQDLKMNISSLPKGVYVLQLNAGGKSFTTKFMKE